jgi:ubiquinone biosynthesis protein
MTQLVIMVYAAVNREIDVVIDVLGDVGALGPTTNRRQLHRALQILIDKYYGLPLSRLDLTTLTNEFADVIRQHDVVIQRDLLLLAKAMATVSGVIARIDPSLDLLELIKPRITRAMSQRFAPSQLSKGGLVWGWHLFSLVRHGPAQLREFVRGMRSGSWKLHVQHENLDRLVNELDRSSNRLAFSVVIAAIIVGSSVVISAASDLTVFGFPVQYFGIAGYLFAGVLGLGLSWAIFRSGRLH